MTYLISSVKEATRLIAKKGNRTRLVVAGILFMFSLVFPMMMGTYMIPAVFGVESVTELEYYSIVYGITLGLGALISLPMASVFVTYTQKLYSETKYGFADIKKRGAYNYFRSFFASIALFIWPIIIFFMIQVTYLLSWDIKSVFETSMDGTLSIPVMCVIIPLWCIVFLVSIFFVWLTNSAFLAPYYYSRGYSAAKAIRMSKKTVARHPFYSDLFSILFITLSVLSTLTFGVLFIVWVCR